MRVFLTGTGGSSSVQIARGGAWVFASFGIQQSMMLVRSIVFARLLLPEDFGLMGLAIVVISAVTLLTQTGVSTAIVQRDELDRDTLNTAWILNVFRGIVLALVLVLLAPLAAEFFDAPTLTGILRVLSLTFVLDGFTSLGLVLLQRDMNFRRLENINLLTSLISLAAGLIAAVSLANVWALVIAQLVGAIAALILSYSIHQFRPQLRFNRARAHEIVSFGKYISGASILNYLGTQGDDAYVGKALGTTQLGYYGLAYRVSNLPATSISHVLKRVTFPAFSKISSDLPLLRQQYLRVLRFTSLVSFPFAAGLFALAPYIVGVLYGEKWLPIVPSFMVLCLFGLERSLGSIASSLLLAQGRSRMLLQLGSIKLIVMVLFIVPLTLRYGILGTSMAVTLSALAVHTIVVPVSSKALSIPVTSILGTMTRPAIGAILMIVTVSAIRLSFDLPLRLIWLLTLGLIGFATYSIVVVPGQRDQIDRLFTWFATSQLSKDENG